MYINDLISLFYQIHVSLDGQFANLLIVLAVFATLFYLWELNQSCW